MLDPEDETVSLRDAVLWTLLRDEYAAWPHRQGTLRVFDAPDRPLEEPPCV